ncbi:hypothetical protein B0H16DRAFT_543570 [Mycena metata]|uniref:Uncharacterized protein n=1 Tax=Mycena metata TaxID=1033252 RepID=A0AAD7H685_9AGAR|nr:hypothetical protein B0H16DRAFT_543570 [Mycena metata]
MDHLALAPELVAECIEHLHESLPDLVSCALVTRAWVYPAQVHLFRALTILGKAFSRPPFGMKFLRLPHLRTLMKDSPHLIPHIRRLTIWLSNEDLATLAEMANFPFTHLEYLHSRHIGSLLRPPVLALQQFISLDTLRTLKLDTGRILDPTVLVEIWSLFPSPLLKRLEFDIPATFEPSPSSDSAF